MATDFRIMCGFFRHPKTLKLFSRHGSDGIIALQMLWEWAAQWRPKGRLYDMTEEDVLLACSLSAGPEEMRERFVADLLEIRWLDKDEDGVMCLHNWEQRQPWVFKEEERKEQAKANALAGWEQRKKTEAKSSRKKAPKVTRSGGGKEAATPAAPASKALPADANADGNAPLLTSPSHSEKDILSEREASGLAELLWGLVLANNPKAKPPKLENWAREIGKMFRLDGRSVEDVKAVIEWSQRDQFWSSNILSADSLRRNFDKLMAKMVRAVENREPSPEDNGGMSEAEYLSRKGKSA